jgi:uncharacterized membrane protein (DUF2068 family)
MRVTMDEAALRAVITYKWVKGSVQILLALALSVTLVLGYGDELGDWAHDFRTHATRAYAVILARGMERVTSPKGMQVTLAALWIDGLVTCLEGWALHRRKRWGSWLVVGVSGSLLPFELVVLVRHVRWSRVLVLVVNAAVVAFLAWHARNQSRHLEAA